MYYNSHKNNSDYYNSYKKEISALAAYKKAERRETLIKFILIFFALTFLVFAALYLYKYFNSNIDSKKDILKNKVLKSVLLKKEQLPISLQIKESINQITKPTVVKIVKEEPKAITSINEKDIALIVETVLSKMNLKSKKALEDQLNEVDNQNYAIKSLKEENHYNKVILSQEENLETLNDSLETINSELNTIIDEKYDIESNYAEEIQEEIVVRENEMRVIIVQKGDTLSKIAQRAYGNYTDYTKIFAANPEIIKNPNQIFVGQRLRIPS